MTQLTSQLHDLYFSYLHYMPHLSLLCLNEENLTALAQCGLVNFLSSISCPVLPFYDPVSFVTSPITYIVSLQCVSTFHSTFSMSFSQLSLFHFLPCTSILWSRFVCNLTHHPTRELASLHTYSVQSSFCIASFNSGSCHPVKLFPILRERANFAR